MTRKTLFRTIIAIRFMKSGNWAAARYCLPRKWKRGYPSWLRPWMLREMMSVLADQFTVHHSDLAFIEGNQWPTRKIGDTIHVRKPARFRG